MSLATDPPPTEVSREQKFVNGIIEQWQQNNGLAARLRRADNPATEYQSWEILARWGINLENEYERLAFATIAANIAKAKSTRSGSVRLGQAITQCYEDGRESDQAKARLRRLLAVDDTVSLCRLLRPLLSLIDSRANVELDYACLLKQIRQFYFDPTRIKAQWAQEFYGGTTQRESTE